MSEHSSDSDVAPDIVITPPADGLLDEVKQRRPSHAGGGDDAEDNFGSFMAEVPPDMLTYRTMGTTNLTRRPSIGQLLYGKAVTASPAAEVESEDKAVDYDAMRRFGMWDGVLARCLLNIFGVIMFLRLGFCIGVAGVWYGSLVIIISATITMITALSLSAICTNGEIQGGGAYFMISRALGPQFGGAIGILFTIANAVAVALYLVGFAEALIGQIQVDNPTWEMTPGGTMDLRLIGIISLIFILILCLNGVDWVVKIQLGLLAVLVVCIISVFIGCGIKGEDTSIAFTGLSASTFRENGSPDWEKGDLFFVLSIFFPAVTGIMAGANISGEIKNPNYSIPVGTIWSIILSGIIYIGLGLMIGASVTKYGEGELRDTQGLLNNNLIMTQVSFSAELIYIGIYAATLSSAIASLVGAPRILQAVAKDKLFGFLAPFAKGHGKNNEPINGYLVTFVIALACVLIGDLNAIAPLITGFFMISYAFINFACFLASYTNTAGWRPSFKYYNKWVSLTGFVLCFAVLFILNWLMGFVTVLIGGALYKYLDVHEPNVSWGSAVEGEKYKSALQKLEKLDKVRSHVKNYRPQLLVLSGHPAERLGLIRYSQQLRRGKGVMIYGEVVLADLRDVKNAQTSAALAYYQERLQRAPLSFLPFKVRRGFMETVLAPTLGDGARSLFQLCGISKIRPNVLLLGYKKDWKDAETDQVEEYVEIIREAFLFRFGVTIVRNWEGVENDKCRKLRKEYFEAKEKLLALSEVKSEDDPSEAESGTSLHVFSSDTSNRKDSVMGAEIEIALDDMPSPVNPQSPTSPTSDGTQRSSSFWNWRGHVHKGPHPEARPGTIDVWWLYDDGGLTMLMPYLLSMHGMWKTNRLRVMAVNVVTEDNVFGMSEGARQMTKLINKFRIKAEIEDVPLKVDKDGHVTGVSKEMISLYQSLVGSKRTPSHRTMRHLKIADQIHKLSAGAAFIHVTLPIPDIHIKARDYMAWLECLSHDLPPFCFIRGNHENVLTFDM